MHLHIVFAIKSRTISYMGHEDKNIVARVEGIPPEEAEAMHRRLDAEYGPIPEPKNPIYLMQKKFRDESKRASV